MPSKYDTETKAQVLALVHQGVPADRAGREHGIPERTAQFWAARMRQVAANETDRELLDEDYRIALRTGDLIQDALDIIQEDGSAAKHLTQLTIARGISLSKITESKSISRPSLTITLIAERTQSFKELETACIEGEAHDVTPLDSPLA